MPRPRTTGRIIHKMDTWLAHGRINESIVAGPIHVYVRKGPYGIRGEICRGVVQIGRVTVSEKSEGKGYFSVLLRWLESLNGKCFLDFKGDSQPISFAMFENVHSPRLHDILTARPGWDRVHMPYMLDGPPHFVFQVAR